MQVARAEHEVVLGGDPDELRQHCRRMREVGVHVHDELGLEAERDAEPLLVGRPDANAGGG